MVAGASHPLSLPSKLLLLVCALLLAACGMTTPVAAVPWVYADVRWLDPSDSPPAADIIAVYARTHADEVQIRLDFLDLSLEEPLDLWISINGEPFPEDTPQPSVTPRIGQGLIILPAVGPIQTVEHTENGFRVLSATRVRVLRNSETDTIEVHFHWPVPNLLMPALEMAVLVKPSGTSSSSDRLPAFKLDSRPPAQAQVLLAFWNTYPAYTPAMALRRWDGAHTGPEGGRHGLGNLLQAARPYPIPLLLLDLKSPTALSALETTAGLNSLQEAARQGWAILPDSLSYLSILPEQVSLPTTLYSNWKQESRQMGLQYGLEASPFFFSTLPSPSAHQAPFSQRWIQPAPIPAEITDFVLSRWERVGNQIVLSLPQYAPPSAQNLQTTAQGPTLLTRQALVQAALNAQVDPSLFLVLGGELPLSSWGDPQAARAGFAYLKAHPWISVLGASQLQSLPALHSRPAGSPLPIDTPFNTLLEQSEKTEQGAPSLALWEALRGLLAPLSPQPSELPRLRQQILPSLDFYLEAARWADAPKDSAQCKQIRVGFPTSCILASKDTFALIDSQTGLLKLLFLRDEQGSLHQVIAPSTQLVSGLSDPSSWRWEMPDRMDPSGFPGAFYRPSELHSRFGVTSETGRITFHKDEGSRIYELISGGLRVEEANWGGTEPLQIPINLDPWQRFEDGGSQRYSGAWQGESWLWSVDKTTLSIQSTSPMTVNTFLESQPAYLLPEDPNQEFSAGHFLPFPLALLRLDSRASLRVDLTLVY